MRRGCHITKIKLTGSINCQLMLNLHMKLHAPVQKDITHSGSHLTLTMQQKMMSCHVAAIMYGNIRTLTLMVLENAFSVLQASACGLWVGVSNCLHTEEGQAEPALQWIEDD